MTACHVGVRPVPQWIVLFFRLSGWVLILPPLLLGLFALILAITTRHPLLILFQMICVYGQVCLMRWFLALSRGHVFRFTRMRKVGLVFVPLSGAAFLA